MRRPTAKPRTARRAELLDLAGVARESPAPTRSPPRWRVPLATDWHTVTLRRTPTGAEKRIASATARARRSGCRRAHRASASNRSSSCRPRRSRRDRTRWRRRGSTAAAASANTCSRPRRRLSATRRTTAGGVRDVHDSAGAQSGRAVRLRRRLRRSLRSPAAARRADDARLRRRVSPVHRAGGRGQRRPCKVQTRNLKLQSAETRKSRNRTSLKSEVVISWLFSRVRMKVPRRI